VILEEKLVGRQFQLMHLTILGLDLVWSLCIGLALLVHLLVGRTEMPVVLVKLVLGAVRGQPEAQDRLVTQETQETQAKPLQYLVKITPVELEELQDLPVTQDRLVAQGQQGRLGMEDPEVGAVTLGLQEQAAMAELEVMGVVLEARVAIPLIQAAVAITQPRHVQGLKLAVLAEGELDHQEMELRGLL
jgi:hypothetical protein